MTGNLLLLDTGNLHKLWSEESPPEATLRVLLGLHSGFEQPIMKSDD